MLKKVLDASGRAFLDAEVLPVWNSESQIAARKSSVLAQANDQRASEGDRKAALQRAQSEARSAAKTKAQQQDQRQKEYREKYGAKVASLVAVLSQELEKVRAEIDNALLEKKGVNEVLSEHSFWSPYPHWYAERRASGWAHENSISTPRDYGFVQWKSRRIESVFVNVKVIMKNANLGEYGEYCWSVGVINDAEFSRYREPLVVECKDGDALVRWQGEHRFESRWDLNAKQ